MNSAKRKQLETEARREARETLKANIFCGFVVLLGVAVCLPVLKWFIITIMTL